MRRYRDNIVDFGCDAGCYEAGSEEATKIEGGRFVPQFFHGDYQFLQRTIVGPNGNRACEGPRAALATQAAVRFRHNFGKRSSASQTSMIDESQSWQTTGTQKRLALVERFLAA